MNEVPPSLVTSTGAAHFRTLDSMRGICAFLVMLLHFPSNSVIVQNKFIHGSWLFVDFFFVLSGFVIASSYSARIRSGMSITKFMFLRFGRIYPTHLVILVMIALFRIAANFAASHGHPVPAGAVIDRDSIAPFIETLTLTHALGLPVTDTWNGPSWSISVEFWTYLLAALSFTIRGRLSVIFACGAVIALAWLALTGDGNLLRVNEYALIRCVLGFSLGCLVYLSLPLPVFSAIFKLNRPSATALELITVCVVVVTVTFIGMDQASLLVPFIFGFAVFVFASERGAVSASLSAKAPTFFGTISYPLYLVHYFLLFRLLNVAELLQKHTSVQLITENNSGKWFDSSTPGGVICSFAAVLIILIAATLLHKFVEEPGRVISRRMAANWGKSQTT